MKKLAVIFVLASILSLNACVGLSTNYNKDHADDRQPDFHDEHPNQHIITPSQH